MMLPQIKDLPHISFFYINNNIHSHIFGPNHITGRIPNTIPLFYPYLPLASLSSFSSFCFLGCFLKSLNLNSTNDLGVDTYDSGTYNNKESELLFLTLFMETVEQKHSIFQVKL